MPEIERLAARWRAGVPAKVLAHDAGVSSVALTAIANQYRHLFPYRRAPGGWDETRVRDAAERWARGHTLPDLCEHFGVKRSTMAMVITRHRALFARRRVTRREVTT